jgi:hypothetical protein
MNIKHLYEESKSAMLNNNRENHALVFLLLSSLLLLPSCKKRNQANAPQSLEPSPATLAYYSEQSVITDPGKYAYLYDTLPETIPELCRTVQGLLLHVFHTHRYGVTLTEKRKKEVRLREVEVLLERAMELAEQPLVQPRDPENRVISHCRDYAVLLCSFLRHKKIPARARTGFATYFNPFLSQCHWICEYWCRDKKEWIQVDSQLDDIQSKHYGIDFDPLNVPAGKFLYAGTEYAMTHWKSEHFYDIKRTLIQDLAALNKMEVEVFDVTCFMDVGETQDRETTKLLNRIAKITTSSSDRLVEIRTIYENHSELQNLIN